MIKVNVKELKNCLNNVIKVIPSKRINNPNYNESILIETNDNTISITATDGMLRFTDRVNILTRKSKIDVIVNGKQFKKIIESISAKEKEVTLNITEKSKLSIKTENNEYSIVTDTMSMFPKARLFKKEKVDSISLNGNILKNLLRGLNIVSTDETRPAMCGVLLEISSKSLKSVTTDGHRMSIITENNCHKLKVKKPVEMIVPSKCMFLLNKIIGDTDVVTLLTDYKIIQFTGQGFSISAELVEEIYPKYKNVIPKNYTNNIVINKSEFLNAITAVKSCLDYKNQVKLTVTKNNIEVFAKNESEGLESKQNITNKNKVVGEYITGFNYKYLTDCINTLQSENIRMEFDKALGAHLFFEDIKDRNLLYIVMPVHL